MSETEMSESAAGEMRPSSAPEETEEDPSTTGGEVPSTEAGEDSEFETEDATEGMTEGSEGALLGEGASPESPYATEDPITLQPEGREELGERSEMSVLVSELEDEAGFSEYEQSDEFFQEERDEAPALDAHGVYSSDVIQVLQSEQIAEGAVASASSIAAKETREKTPEKDVKRTYSFNESDEELAKIPVPVMKTNKVIPKLPEPKFPVWPVMVFQCENLYKIMEVAVPRFFPRNFPYSTRGVTKRCSLLAQYLQRKVFQMGHDRRKLITVVRYHQKNWNGHRAVIRWLWCMETDALVKYAHEGECFVVSAVVVGIYMD